MFYRIAGSKGKHGQMPTEPMSFRQGGSSEAMARHGFPKVNN